MSTFNLHGTDFSQQHRIRIYTYFLQEKTDVATQLIIPYFAHKSAMLPLYHFHICIGFLPAYFIPLANMSSLCHAIYLNYILIIKCIHLTNKSPSALFFSEVSQLFLDFFPSIHILKSLHHHLPNPSWDFHWNCIQSTDLIQVN